MSLLFSQTIPLKISSLDVSGRLEGTRSPLKKTACKLAPAAAHVTGTCPTSSFGRITCHLERKLNERDVLALLFLPRDYSEAQES